LQVDPISNPGHTPAGARAGCDPAGDGGSVEFRKQRLIAAERVRFFAVGGRPQAPAFEQSGDPASDASSNPGHFGIARGRQRNEEQVPPLDRGVDAVEGQRLEVEIEQQHSKIPIVPLLPFIIVFIPTQGKNSRSSIIPPVTAIG
jgi:hypothetical protein